MIEDRKSGILAVTVTDGDATRAAAMGRAYVEELDRLVRELNTSTAHRERVFLEDRLKTIKQDLDAAARDFGEFASKNAAIDIKEQGKATNGSRSRARGPVDRGAVGAGRTAGKSTPTRMCEYGRPGRKSPNCRSGWSRSVGL